MCRCLRGRSNHLPDPEDLGCVDVKQRPEQREREQSRAERGQERRREAEREKGQELGHEAETRGKAGSVGVKQRPEGEPGMCRPAVALNPKEQVRWECGVTFCHLRLKSVASLCESLNRDREGWTAQGARNSGLSLTTS